MADGSTGLSLNRHVRFYLRPFHLPRDLELVLRLTPKDGSEGGEFDVPAAPVDEQTSVFAKFGGRNDTASLLRTLMAGKDLIFEVLQDGDSLVKLPLSNDGAFKTLWDESAARFAEIETAYDLARSQKQPPPADRGDDLIAEVRKNPKGYAIWMVDGEDGGYNVLLVKLAPDGNMEDGWQLGQTFIDRAAQGSYALEAARDLGIKLMDVVNNQ